MINKLWLEFTWGQEAQQDSLYHFLECLKSWWKMRPRLVCCDCKQQMWICGERGMTFCSRECAHYYGGASYDEDELPF